MENTMLSALDQDELFQLALAAGEKGDSAAALVYLKHAVSREDASARAHYLLGAEYAQIGLYPRAIEEIEAAVALDPNLHAARLQLGMLWLGANDNARAADALAPLTELAGQDPMRLFGAGLLCLINNDEEGALRRLEEGMALNTVNLPLNGDMQRIVEHVRASRAAEPDAGAEQHIMLSAYTGNLN